MLGYRDSGMAGSEANANPDCFAQAPLDEAVERLVADRPPDPAPGHGGLRRRAVGLSPPRPSPGPRRRAWRPSAPAGDRDRFPAPGAAWQPDKLYYTVFSVARFREIHEKFEELGPRVAVRRASGASAGRRCPTRSSRPSVDISDFADVRRQALLAHATQVDPNSPFWFGLPPEVMRTIHPLRRLPVGPGRAARTARRSAPDPRRPGPVEDRPVRRASGDPGVAGSRR